MDRANAIAGSLLLVKHVVYHTQDDLDNQSRGGSEAELVVVGHEVGIPGSGLVDDEAEGNEDGDEGEELDDVVRADAVFSGDDGEAEEEGADGEEDEEGERHEDACWGVSVSGI